MAENDSKIKHSLLFMGLVTSFQQSALQSLGKLVSPESGKAEVNLDGAAAYIDMLDMLSAKTKGNLSTDEANTLNQILSHLKLNYIEELNKPKDEETSSSQTGDAPDKSPEEEKTSKDKKDQGES